MVLIEVHLAPGAHTFELSAEILRDTRTVRTGQRIQARLGDGSLTAEVESIESEQAG